MKVSAREALELRETPYGSVGVVHDGADLQAWWTWKDDEAVDPEWSTMEREDLLYVIEGTVPKGYPEPELFKMSIGFIRPDGTESNIYSSVYNNYMGLSESPLPDLCGLRGCNAVGLGSGAAPATAVKPRTRRSHLSRHSCVCLNGISTASRWAKSYGIPDGKPGSD